jgi:hypothetical protein
VEVKRHYILNLTDAEYLKLTQVLHAAATFSNLNENQLETMKHEADKLYQSLPEFDL